LKSLRPSVPGLALIFLVLFLFFPATYLAFGSLWSSRPGAPGYLTLANYADVLFSPDLYTIITNTLIYSIGAATLGNVIGFLLAFTVTKTDAPFRRTLAIVPIITLVVPIAMDNLAWIHLFSPNSGLISGPINAYFTEAFGFKEPVMSIFSIWGMMWTTGTAFTSISYLVLSGPMSRIDPRLEEASRICGGNGLITLRRVTLPLLWPALLSSFLLTFVLALEAFDTPAFIGVPAKIEVLTSSIYRSMVNLVPPQYGLATATSFLLLGITLSVLYFYSRATRFSEKYVTVSGSAGGASITRLGKWRPVSGALALLYLFVHPIAIFTTIILASFHRFWNPNFLFKALTLENYEELPLRLVPYIPLPIPWVELSIPFPIVNSFIISLSTAISVGTAGFFVAYMYLRSKGGLQRLAGIASSVPLGFPTIVLGVGLLWALISLPGNLYGTVWALTIAYTVRYVPISLRFLTGPLLQLHKELEEASRVCGGSWFYTIRKVIVPNMRAPVVALSIYVMIVSFKELGAAVMLVTNENMNLSAAVFAIYQTGEPLITAAAAVLYVALLTSIVLFAWLVLGISPLSLTSRGQRDSR
jgi:iron(III) transport system permease protein